MKVQISSDLHINCLEHKKYITKGESEYLILAGDICNLKFIDEYIVFMRKICLLYKKVFLVPGNHEYYVNVNEKVLDYEILSGRLLILQNSIDNLVILNSDYIDIEDVRIYGCLLWCNIPDGFAVKRLPILLEDGNWVYDKWLNKQNKEQIEYINAIIKKSQNDKKRLVIVSHYPPSVDTLLERHIGTPDVYYYHNNLDALLSKDKVSTWIYGHTHVTKDYMTKGNTRVISNQYKSKGYDHCKIIDI